VAPTCRAEFALLDDDLGHLETFDFGEGLVELAAPRLRGWCWLVKGVVAERLGRHDEAIGYFDLAVPVLRSTSDHYRLLRTNELPESETVDSLSRLGSRSGRKRVVA